MTTHGGKREGAGRPRKRRKAQGTFADAEAYLSAVVEGSVEPDALRIAAAKALIAYQTARQRAPKKSPTPRQMAEIEARSIEAAVADEFEAKAAAIRAKHRRN